MFRAPHETFYKTCCVGTGFVSGTGDGNGCDLT